MLTVLLRNLSDSSYFNLGVVSKTSSHFLHLYQIGPCTFSCSNVHFVIHVLFAVIRANPIPPPSLCPEERRSEIVPFSSLTSVG